MIRPLAVPLVPLPPGYKYDLLGNCEPKIPYRSKVLNLSRALNVVQLRSKALLPKVGLYFGDLSAAQLRSEASLPKGCLFFEKASNKGEVDLKPNKFDFQLNLSGAHLSEAHLNKVQAKGAKGLQFLRNC